MKMAEILRKLADIIDNNSAEDNSMSSTVHRMTPVSVTLPGNDDSEVMVPPLQSKLELLKKSVGVENIYDEEDTDELSVIKKNAGLNMAAQIEASEDNDITG
jgi:hypothetical protein